MATVLSACGGGDSDPPSEASATIGAAGGTLDGPDGTRVVIPPGALAQDTTITIARRSSGAPTLGPDGYTQRGATYEFTPHDLVFAQPVTLRMPVAAGSAVLDESAFRAGNGGDWESLGLPASNGMAEWQTASFSWYAYWDCAYSGSNPDPYPCTAPTGFTTVTPTPADALTLTSFSAQAANRFYRVRQATTLRLDASYSAAADCGDARIKFKRRRAGDAQAVVLLDTPATVTAVGSRIRARTSFTVALSNADNGSTKLITEFRCRRAYQSPSRASLPPSQQYTGAYDVMVFDAQIPEPPQTVAPAVTQAPANQSVSEPASATFSAAATGTPTPTVQWEQSTDSGATWVPIAGATASSWTTPATAVSDNGKQFRAVFSNPSGSATTASATLTVNTAELQAFSWDFESDMGAELPGMGVEPDVVDLATNASIDDQFLTQSRTGVQGYAGLGPAGAPFTGSLARFASGTKFVLDLSGLPAHSALSLRFLLAAIDSLDGSGTFPAGDFLRIEVDGVTIFRESFDNSGGGGPQSYVPPAGAELARKVDLGFGGPGGFYTDSAYDMALEPRLQRIAHTASRAIIVFTFEGPGAQPMSDESWGIDNLRVVLQP